MESKQKEQTGSDSGYDENALKSHVLSITLISATLSKGLCDNLLYVNYVT